MVRQAPVPIPDTDHDAMALLVDAAAMPRLYQPVCKCGWRGAIAVHETAVAGADWHNEREESTDHGGPR